MQMMETTLLTGPYDWDPQLVPRREYDTRLDIVRRVLRERGLDGLIVGGTSPEHGALAWLTGFTPKLGPALAFIPAQGDLRIAFSGGAAMLPSAQRLTFIEKVQAVRDVGQDVAAWLRDSGGTNFAFWGEYAITSDVRHAIARTAPSAMTVLDEALDPLRRRKSSVEIELIRSACKILSVATGTLRSSIANGSGVRSAALACERAAYAQGAQDVRMLVSLRNGGMPQPLDARQDPQVDPLLACVAVRFAGYWAEGLLTHAIKPNAAMAPADTALAAVLNAIRPGIATSSLANIAANAIRPHQPHPLVHAHFGNGIGLSREEAPISFENNSMLIQTGDVLTLRVGVFASNEETAIASAMLVVKSHGAEVFWK